MTGYIWGLFLGIVWKTSKFSKRSGSWFIGDQGRIPAFAHGHQVKMRTSIRSCHSEEANVIICYLAHHLWPTKNLSYPQPRLSFLPFNLKSDDHCRLEAIDSSVAGVSNNMSENISFKPINDCEALPQNDMLRFIHSRALKPLFERPLI